MPTLVIERANGETVKITQTTAILEYLEEAYPETTRLLPEDPILRATVRTIYNIIAVDVQPLHNLRMIKSMEEPEKTAWCYTVVYDGFTVIEGILKKTAGKCCVGDQITFADIALVPSTGRFDVLLEDFPMIDTVVGYLKGLPEFAAADGPSQPDHPSKHL